MTCNHHHRYPFRSKASTMTNTFPHAHPQSLDDLSLWLLKNPNHLQECGNQENHCLWSHAIRLAMRHSHHPKNWEKCDSGKMTIDDMDHLFLSKLLVLVKQGLKIDKSYHYRTSFLYEAFIVLANTRPQEPVKNIFLELYGEYIKQSKKYDIRVFGDLKDILTKETYKKFRAQKIKETIIKELPEKLPSSTSNKKM